MENNEKTVLLQYIPGFQNLAVQDDNLKVMWRQKVTFNIGTIRNCDGWTFKKDIIAKGQLYVFY